MAGGSIRRDGVSVRVFHKILNFIISSCRFATTTTATTYPLFKYDQRSLKHENACGVV